MAISRGDHSSYVYEGCIKIGLARQTFRWTLALAIGMKRCQFILIATLVALLFGGVSKAMSVAPNRWTPENRSAADMHDGGGNLQSILHPQSSILVPCGGLLARTDTNGSTFYHADGSGNITALIDGSENIVARYAYNPFGKVIAQWGTLANGNEMQFSSMPFYSSPQIYGYLGRFYDPNLQRWPNQDPIGERGGINLYSFANNCPVGAIDTDGLEVGYLYDGNGGVHTPFDGPQAAGMGQAAINGVNSAVNGAFWLMDKGDQAIDAMRNSQSPFTRAVGEGALIGSWVYGGPETKGIRKARDLEKAVKAAEDAAKSAKVCPAARMTGDALDAARKAFNAMKPKAWMEEATKNASKYTPDQLERMRNGLAPIGSDNFPMEIHHITPLAEGGQNTMDNFEFLTRTDHRLGDNYKANHPNLP